jgi:hypothetical protein
MRRSPMSHLEVLFFLQVSDFVEPPVSLLATSRIVIDSANDEQYRDSDTGTCQAGQRE